MHWRTRFGISLCAGAAAAGSILLCGMAPSAPISAESAESAAPQPAVVSQDRGSAAVYSLRSYNGWIGVYQGETLVYCSDILVDTLPNSDRSILERGIETESWDEVLLLLEDFGS